jgi:hypothetical protein
MAAPLAAKSTLPVGYGEAATEAFAFALDDGVASGVGFLRLFVSTTYVDMTALQQPSPFFGDDRKGMSSFRTVSSGGKVNPSLSYTANCGVPMKKPPAMDIWDVWTYVMIIKIEAGIDKQQ